VAILSDNGIDHALLALGAMHVGVPVAPISPAYSLMSKDYSKLKYIFDLVQPGPGLRRRPRKVQDRACHGGREIDLRRGAAGSESRLADGTGLSCS
jgi:hypothetical protein